MSLDDPGLETVPVEPDSPDDRDPDRPDDDTAVTDPAEPSRRHRSPDELIALAEREHADRAASAQRAAVHPDPAELGEAAANGAAPGRGRRSKRRRARKVRRIVRRFDAWSVLKFSLLFYFCVYVIAMVAGVLLWSAAQQAGTIEGFEGFIADLGAYESFQFEGDQIFNGALIGGLVLVVAGAAGNVLLAVLFNLISDLTGGIRLTVIEEERAVVPRQRRSPSEGREPRSRSVTELTSSPDSP